MKIFLDIDGVLTTDNEYYLPRREFYENNKWADELSVPYQFNKKCVEAFNIILGISSDIEIILSSDWRLHWSLEELDVIFKNNGVIKSPVDITEKGFSFWDSRARVRAGEIGGYLIKHSMIDSETQTIPLEDWIIIDDLNVGYFLPDGLKDRFFQTSDENGILEDGVIEEIIAKIKKYETEETDKG